jgi:hypothetical protein
MARTRIGTQTRGRTETVETGHHHIERDEIGANTVHDVQTLDTIGSGHHLEALKLEIDLDQLPDNLVIVHDKNPAGHTWHTTKPRHTPPPASGFCPFPPLPTTRACRRLRRCFRPGSRRN